MPANLPPEAYAKLARYSEARSIEEKVKALEEFISAVPKHKGAENLLLWARKRLSELKEELEEQRRRKKSGTGPRIFIEKEGAAQIAVIGPPNTGKSSLLSTLTGAKTRVADYPFTTNLPVPGMLRYEDIYFQLIDTPPISKTTPIYVTKVSGIVRNADAVIIVLSLEDDPLNQYLEIRDLLLQHGIYIEKPRGIVRIEKKGEGISFSGSGRIIDGTFRDVELLLSKYRIYRAQIYIEGEVSLSDVELAIIRNYIYKPTIVLANKIDLPGSVEKYKQLYSYLKSHQDKSVWLIPISVKKMINLDRLGEILFRKLGIIRVYTKKPNSEPSKTPLTLPKGSTVRDLAEKIHGDMLEYFQYAKIWGPSAKYPGERVGLDHLLEDGDIVEIHSRK